jgi:hypothetical protein
MSAVTSSLMAPPRLAPVESGTLPGALRQLSLIAALIGVTALLAMAHAATPARLLFVVGAMAIAVRAIRRSPWDYLTVSLWFWTISPFARRVIDYYGGFEFTNLVLVTPNLITLLMIPSIMTSRQLIRRQGMGLGMLLFGPTLYGLLVSFLRGDVVPGIIAAGDWFPPLLYYLYLINQAPTVRNAEDHIRHFLGLNMLVVGAYGLFQYFDPLVWDVRWVLDTKMLTVGQPVPYGMKPFSTLNGPGVCAAWLSAQLMLTLHFRNRLSIVALPATALLLALTLVRSAIGATVIGLVVAVLIQGGRMARSVILVAVALALVAGIVSVLDPKVSDSLISRFSSVNDIGSDESAIARAEIYREAPSLLNQVPFGLGIGAIGRGAAASNGALVVVDSGPVALYLSLGWFAGTVYLAGMALIVVQALVGARATRSPAAVLMATTALGGATTIVFSALVGLQGVVIWLCAGYASAVSEAARLGEGDRR